MTQNKCPMRGRMCQCSANQKCIHLDKEKEECPCEVYEHGLCTMCGKAYEPDDFTGATPGDR